MGSKERILDYFLVHVGKDVPRTKIIKVAQTSEWARRVRDLRHEGWQIEPTKIGYRLISNKRLAAKDTRAISQKLRYKIMQAANGACMRCGARISEGAKLVVDHKIPLNWGGKTEEDNLWAICTDCNQGKRAFYSDENAADMSKVMEGTSAKARILAYFRLNIGKKVTKDQLMMVAKISDWPRRVRELREAGWDIVSNVQNSNLKPGEYILKSDRSS